VGFSNPLPFHNIASGNAWGDRDYFQILGFMAPDPTPWAFGNFLAGGPKLTCSPGAGTLTIFVSPSGNDSTGNGGSAAPFKTIARAMFYAQNIDMLGNAVVIQLADGTYSAGIVYNAEAGNNCRGPITLRGNVSFPGNVIINDAAGGIRASGGGANILVSGVTLTSSGVFCQKGASVYITDGVQFGACPGGSHIFVTTNGHVTLASNYTISGSADNHIFCNEGGIVDNSGPLSVAVNGTPAFALFFAASVRNALITLPNMTYIGSATGARYSATFGGGVDTNGGGANYFPGSVAGTVASPGWYN